MAGKKPSRVPEDDEDERPRRTSGEKDKKSKTGKHTRDHSASGKTKSASGKTRRPSSEGEGATRRRRPGGDPGIPPLLMIGPVLGVCVVGVILFFLIVKSAPSPAPPSTDTAPAPATATPAPKPPAANPAPAAPKEAPAAPKKPAAETPAEPAPPAEEGEDGESAEDRKAQAEALRRQAEADRRERGDDDAPPEPGGD